MLFSSPLALGGDSDHRRTSYKAAYRVLTVLKSIVCTFVSFNIMSDTIQSNMERWMSLSLLTWVSYVHFLSRHCPFGYLFSLRNRVHIFGFRSLDPFSLCINHS